MPAAVSAPTMIVGLDLGQAADFTALAVLQQTFGPDPFSPGDTVSFYGVRHLERLPLGTPYTATAGRPSVLSCVEKIVSAPPLAGSATLAVDQTGVGRPVVDIFRQAGLPVALRPVTITGGTAVSENEDGWHVPKKELVSTLQVLLQGRRLQIVRRLKEADALMREMVNFKVKITAAANETFGAWREGQHDDLVLAVALAAWVGEHCCCPWEFGASTKTRGGGSLFAAAPPGVWNDPRGRDSQRDFAADPNKRDEQGGATEISWPSSF